jgi:hypothetical protein
MISIHRFILTLHILSVNLILSLSSVMRQTVKDPDSYLGG